MRTEPEESLGYDNLKIHTQEEYAKTQHDLCCKELGLEPRHDRDGDTLLESVRAFRVTETGYFEKPTVTIIRTTTPARAKHRVWDSAHSAGYLIEFKSLKVVRAPEYDAAKLKQNWCYSEDFARRILPENVKGHAAAGGTPEPIK